MPKKGQRKKRKRKKEAKSAIERACIMAIGHDNWDRNNVDSYVNVFDARKIMI